MGKVRACLDSQILVCLEMVMGVENDERKWLICAVVVSAWAMVVAGFPAALGPLAGEVSPSLLGAFVTTSGVRMLAMKVAVVFAGFFHDLSRTPTAQNLPIAPSILLATAAYVMTLGLALLGWSLESSSTFTMFLGNASTGTGMGILYLLGIMVPTEWLCARRERASHEGEALCISMGAYVCGTLAGTWILSTLLNNRVELSLCLKVCTLGLVVPGLLTVGWLQPPTERSRKEAVEEGSGQRSGLALLKRKELYLFLFVVGVSQGPPWAFIDTFDTFVVSTFEFTKDQSARLFSILSVFGLFVRLTAGFMCEAVGAKRLTILSMICLVVSLVVLRIGKLIEISWVLILGMILHWIPLSSITTASVLIARENFGTLDTGLAFGLGKGASGFFIFFFSILTADVAAATTDTRTQSFGNYCNVCILIGCVGIFAAAILRDPNSPNPSKQNPHEAEYLLEE